MAKGILYILLLSFVSCKSDIATNRRIQHGYIDLQFYLNNAYNLAADPIVYTPQDKGEGLLRYHYMNSTDTDKGLVITYRYQTDRTRHAIIYGSLEKRYENLDEDFRYQQQPHPYEMKYENINGIRCIVSSDWADARPLFKGFARYDQVIVVEENIGLIKIGHYNHNYLPGDSIKYDRFIDSIFQSVIIKRN